MVIENSRKLKRKEERVLRKQDKHTLWIKNQKQRKLGRATMKADAKDFDDNGEISDISHKSKTSYVVKDGWENKKSEDVLKPQSSSKSVKKIKKVKTKKTKFEEYLDLENRVSTAEEDSKVERRLAKKLKVKNGKLGGDDDDINFLLGGSDQEYDRQLDEKKKKTKRKKKLKEDEDSLAIPEAISFVENEIETSCSQGEDKRIEVTKAGLIQDKTWIESKDVKKKENKVKEKRKKTKFEEYLVLENIGAAATAEEDLKWERRLAKKLKVKEGKLPSADDGMNCLFEDSEQEYGQQDDDTAVVKSIETKKKNKKARKKRETLDQDIEDPNDGTSHRIVHENKNPSPLTKECVKNSKLENADVEAPKTRNYVAPHLRACTKSGSSDNILIRRRIKGLLNKISKNNVEAFTGEVYSVFQSVGRSFASEIVGAEVLASCVGGPRGNKMYAATFAAFVSGLTCKVGMDFGAKFLVLFAKSFEEEYLKEDNLSLRNLTLLLSFLYLFGVCSSDLIYDFLMMLTKQMTEVDVSTILTILKCCGVELRRDDPGVMKDFIFSVQNRVTLLKASCGDDFAKTNGRRMEFMLETICDIKNNKKRKEDEDKDEAKALDDYVKKCQRWLQQLQVDNYTVRGIKWGRLLDQEKNGQWWLAGDLASSTDNAEDVANTIDKEVLEAQKMLELAASQRMNTDIRKAIFCVIMSGEDYLDAFEKLIRLNLKGKQDREIMRVLLECCLDEKIFNKYYTALAMKLCSHDKNHKFTLQYCLWDQLKELGSMPLVRSNNLAKFMAEMFASYTLSIAILKTADLGDISKLTPKKIMHFRMLFDTLFDHPDSVVWNIFTRVGVAPDLEDTRTGMEYFIMEHVLPSSKNYNAKNKFKLVKKAMDNSEGVLM